MSGPCVCLGKATNTLSISFRIVCNRIAREICAIFLRWLPYVAGRLGQPVPPNAGGCHSCAVGKIRRRKRGHFRPTRLQLPTPQGFRERSAGKLNFRSDAVDQVEIVRAGFARPPADLHLIVLIATYDVRSSSVVNVRAIYSRFNDVKLATLHFTMRAGVMIQFILRAMNIELNPFFMYECRLDPGGKSAAWWSWETYWVGLQLTVI